MFLLSNLQEKSQQFCFIFASSSFQLQLFRFQFILLKKFQQTIGVITHYVSKTSLRVNVSCVLKCSRANVPCAYSHANVPRVLKCSSTNMPCVLTCSRANVPCALRCSRVNVSCVLTCSPANVAYMLTCLRAHMSSFLVCLCTHVSTCLLSSHVYVPTCLESLAPHWLALLRDPLPTCPVCLVSSFDASFSSFTAIVVGVVHTAGKV